MSVLGAIRGAVTRDRFQRVILWIRKHPGRAAEVAIALLAAAFLFGQEGLRAVWIAVLRALASGALAGIRLLGDDTIGTLVTGAATIAKTALVTAPVVRLAMHMPAHRRAWIPLYSVFWVLSLPMLFPAIATLRMAALLTGMATAGWIAAKRPWWRPLALVPTLVAFEPALSHSPLGDFIWTQERLASRCATNDGARPEGFRDDMAVARYFGVTPVSADWLLLTGERGSWWIRRRPDGTAAFERPSRLSGNLWEGCLAGDDVWLTKLGRLYRVTRVEDPENERHERIKEFRMPDPVGLGIELDFTDAICDVPRGSIYAGELIQGGLRELSPETGEVRRSQVGGLNLQVIRRRDGIFTGIDTNRLFVFDPARREVVEERSAGVATLGVDVCPIDDTAAVTDLSGRLRLFRRDAAGRYAFDQGIFLASPRRVAFSKDCEVLGVTSGDDKTVYVVRRNPLEVIRKYSIGPGLRDLIFSGPRRLAAADACTVTFLDASTTSP